MLRVRLLIALPALGVACGLWVLIQLSGIACRFANSIHCLLWVWLVACGFWYSCRVLRVRLLIVFISCFGCGLWLVGFDTVVGDCVYVC